ncbi:hypothetical protein D7030_09625 [Flavobacteriaceae bacterium AU392]|nr:hypothetical protein D1817_07185 [Flavobacteriaceae bacterium]RKM83546.1 hypothetical protein D7030_09625 [Flavobacteriaceae bacterium AU392]
MKKYISIIIALVSVALTSCQPNFKDNDSITEQEKEIAIKKIANKLKKSGYAFNETFLDIEERFAKSKHIIDTTTTIKSFTSSINKILYSYKVSHLWVNSPDRLTIRKNGSDINIGANFIRIKEGYFISRIVKDGVADKGGLKPGDILLRKNDSLITSSLQLKGKASEQSEILLKRADSILTKNILYFKHQLFSKDTLSFINKDIALITVNTFRKGVYDRDYIEAMFLKAQNTKKIVLDLRSNGGGNVNNVRHLLSMIIPTETICQYFVYRKHHNAFFKKYMSSPNSMKELVDFKGKKFTPKRSWLSWDPEIYTGEIIVIIDERVGSGGEIFSISVQDVKRGKIIGKESLGMVLFANDYNLNKGMNLNYPFGEAIRLNGINLEGNPCIPDIEFSREETANNNFIIDFIKNYKS